MITQDQQTVLSSLPFEVVLDEAAKRLAKKFEQCHGRKFLYGYFRFIFNRGQFVGVEDRLKSRIYWAQKGVNVKY